MSFLALAATLATSATGAPAAPPFVVVGSHPDGSDITRVRPRNADYGGLLVGRGEPARFGLQGVSLSLERLDWSGWGRATARSGGRGTLFANMGFKKTYRVKVQAVRPVPSYDCRNRRKARAYTRLLVDFTPRLPSGHRRLTVRVAPLVVDCVPQPG